MKKIIMMASAIALAAIAGGTLVGCSDDAKKDDAHATQPAADNHNMAQPAPVHHDAAPAADHHDGDAH